MFRNQNTKPKDPEARKELETEENIDNDVSGTDLFGSLLNSGNENAVKEIIGNNIIKNTEDDDDDTDLFAGFGSEDKKESKPAPKKKPVNIIQEDDDDETDLFGDFGSEDKKKSKPVPKKKPANIIQEDDDDRGNLFGDFGEEASKESDPGAAAIKNQIKKIKGVVIKENAKKAGEIKIPAKQYGLKDASKNIYPGEKPAIQEFYEDPEEEPHIDYQGEGKLNRRVHYRKPKHTDADADRSRNKKFSDWRIENAKKARKKELERINDEQKRVAGLDFTLQKLPARNKAGWFRKFLTNLAIAAGSTIGKGFNWIGAQFRRLFDSSFAANYNLAKSDKAKNPAITQKKRVHDVIPGWNGEKFQKGPNGEDNILADFRRIPTVWSTITAG